MCMYGRREAAGRPVCAHLCCASQDQFMLLDRQHQALGFDDMVIAVRSHAGRTPIDFACQRKPLALDHAHVARPVFAALLTSLWALGPTHHLVR